MSEHDTAGSTSEQGGLESRFIPGARIEARDIAAINVVSGVQNIAEQHIHLPGQKYVPPLHRPRRAEHFQDRESERAWLLSHLHPGQIVTICGPGGMGKTALVAEILWTLAPEDTPPALFPHGLVFHTFYGQPEAAVALEQLARTFGEDPLPTPMQAAQRALSGKHVLLVLDGAEEAENLEQVLSVCASCTVLVTSRRRSDAADPALLLDLQRLPPDDAVEVVKAWQAQRQANEAVVARICQLVGGLPLALRLAGSYLALHPEEGKEYLAWLEEDLWGALDQGSSSRKSVPVLLKRNVARLRPEAQAVLRLVGLLALAPFTRELVAGVLEFSAAVARHALEEVMDYGLLVRVGTSYEVSHPLIHTYARQVLLAGEEATQQAALVAHLVTVLTEHFPEVDQPNWEACERLVPHIQAVPAHLEQLSSIGFLEKLLVKPPVKPMGKMSISALLQRLARPIHPKTLHLKDLEQRRTTQAKAAALFGQAGRYLQERGRYEQAALLLQRALAIYEHELGLQNLYTATSLNNLALLYRDQGKYAEAEPLLQRVLAISERQLGPQHPNTATSLNSLAQLYYLQGKYAEAEPLFQRALTIREQQVGLNHPDTATSLNDLAQLYKAQGKYAEAEPLLQRALAIYERELGANHPTTQIVQQNYTSLLKDLSPPNEQH